ncbi:MAG: AsmA family protein [Kiritimatiellae bacterium]|nr:AsmA family protein [Kiritimatiellia bacterium]
MKKALKILLWTVGGLLALVLVLVLAIPLWLGPAVTTVANKVAPEYTGTPFSLDGVSINPYTGKYRVTRLTLGNPAGYPVPTAFSVSSVFVDVEMPSLFSDTIHIREIRIDDPYVSYVSNEGTNNFEWIGAHVKEKIGPQEEKAEPKEEREEGPGKKVVIDKITVAGTRVKLKIMPEMPIPTITLTDIGKDNGGATWEEVGKAVSDAVMKAMSSIGEGLASALGALGDGASQVVGGATNLLGNVAGALGGATTNLLGGASDALGGATSNLLGGASGALGGATTNLLVGASGAVGSATKVLGDSAKKLGNLGGLLGGSDDAKASETNKPAAGGAVDAGKSAGQGAVDAGKSVGQGVIDVGKSLGEGAAETGKAIGEGLRKLNPFGK